MGIPGLKVIGTTIKPKWLNIGDNLSHQVINILATSLILLLVQINYLLVFNFTHEIPLESLELRAVGVPGVHRQAVGMGGQVGAHCPGSNGEGRQTRRFILIKPNTKFFLVHLWIEMQCTTSQVSTSWGGVVLPPVTVSQTFQNGYEWLRHRPLFSERPHHRLFVIYSINKTDIGYSYLTSNSEKLDKACKEVSGKFHLLFFKKYAQECYGQCMYLNKCKRMFMNMKLKF